MLFENQLIISAEKIVVVSSGHFIQIQADKIIAIGRYKYGREVWF